MALWLCAAVAAVLFTFRHVLTTPPEQLSGRYDVYRYFGPLCFFSDSALHSGQFPFWNPLTYCGMPYAASPQPALFYPPNLARALLNFHPTPYSTQAGIVALMGLHVLLAGAGTYLLARAHGLSRAGAAGAAISFAFSALMVRRVCEYHFVFTLNWLPLILLLVKGALDARTLRVRAAHTAAAGLLLGVALLGGFLQIANYIGLAIGAYAVFYALFARGRELSGAARRPWRRWPGDAVCIAAVFLLAGLVAAAVLVPAAELAGFTAREKGAAVGFYSDLSKASALNLLKDVVVYPGMKYQSEAVRGSGATALLLAVAGLFWLRRRDMWVFAALYLVLLDCSFGPPFPVSRLVNLLTPFAPSAYTRAYDVALLPLSLLAGFGIDAVVARGRWWRSALHLALVAAAGVALAYAVHAWATPGLYVQAGRWMWALPAAACAVAILAKAPRLAPVAGIALALLIFAETTLWAGAYVPWLTRKPFTEPADRFAAPKQWPAGNYRGTDPMANRSLFELRPVMNGYDPLHLKAVREVIAAPPRSTRYHRLVNDWECTAELYRGNLLLKRPFWLARQWVRGSLPPKRTLFPPATTAFLPDGGGEPALEIPAAAVRASGASERVLTATPAGVERLCRAVPAGQKHRTTLTFDLPTQADGRPPGPAGALHSMLVLEYRADGPCTIQTEFSDTASRREHGTTHHTGPSGAATGRIEIPMPDYARGRADITLSPKGRGSFEVLKAQVLSDADDEDGMIRIVERGVNRVRLEVGELDGPRVLLFLDAWYPGWKACVNGRPASILRADDAFKAVALPAGTHAVEFTFAPPRVYAGMALTALAALACLALIASGLRRGRG